MHITELGPGSRSFTIPASGHWQANFGVRYAGAQTYRGSPMPAKRLMLMWLIVAFAVGGCATGPGVTGKGGSNSNGAVRGTFGLPF